MSIRQIIFCFLLSGFMLVQAQTAPPFIYEIPAIFSDNMVLQQQARVPFWGKALPQSKISITASWGAAAQTKAAPDSLWQAKLKTPKAGGPFEITLQIGASRIVYKNVLIGEVWLCSGQSNMEMPLAGWPPQDTIAGSAQAIQTAQNPNLRLFTVTRAYSHQPQFNCVGQWQECNPQTAARFSATAFYFGRKLQAELNIPIGLIHTSWGGTPVQAWTSKSFLAQWDEFKPILANIDASAVQILKLNDWLNQYPMIDVNQRDAANKWRDLDFQDAACAQVDYDDRQWYEMSLPIGWENTEVGNFDGAVWFRKQIEIPASWLNQELVIELGPIDDVDLSFVNGQKVGGYEGDGFWQTNRVYTIPKEWVAAKVLTIAVRVIDSQGGGGLWGKKEQLNLHLPNSDEKISLSGAWKYLPVAEYRAGKFYVLGASGEVYFARPKLPVALSASTPTLLYNAMIRPLVPYTIKGAIWYQGEANTGQPELYQILLPLMIENWRADWNLGRFPFYFVQIAPFDYGSGTPSQRLREAQLLTLKTPKTGMVVTLDIGNPRNIHPANKKDVGERLASWALAKDYGQKLDYSGPLYQSMKVVDNKIVMSFKHTEGGLVLKADNQTHHILIAGADQVFKPADVKINGNRLVVSHPDIKQPVAVRYAWSNMDTATLFNGAGLPASSFRTDQWKE